MSQLVRLEGKHTWQNAHCAVEPWIFPSRLFTWRGTVWTSLSESTRENVNLSNIQLRNVRGVVWISLADFFLSTLPLSLKIQCTLWPILIKLLYNVKGWTTKKTSRCLLRSAACNHNLKLTQNNSQQWNQSMVELEGNKIWKQQCVTKSKGDFTSIPAESQATESLWAAAK